jgi:hypothetical protein
LLVAGVVAIAVLVAAAPHKAATAGLGLQGRPAPWPPEYAHLARRLGALHLPGESDAAFHIHVRLRIFVGGQPVPVPAGIGIDPAVGYAPLHTHDASGVIHVESPTVRTYTLGELFDVWGVRFTPGCLGGDCTAGGRQLRVYVDGRRYRGDPTALALAAHQELVVAFGTAAQLPSPVPSGYQFPPGL